MFPKNTILLDKKTGQPEYQKLGDNDWDWWVCLNSNYLVEKEITKTVFIPKDKNTVLVDDDTDENLIDLSKYNKKIVKEISHDLFPESNKSLYDRNGKLNRFGFRINDEQLVERDINIYRFLFYKEIEFLNLRIKVKIFWSNNKFLPVDKNMKFWEYLHWFRQKNKWNLPNEDYWLSDINKKYKQFLNDTIGLKYYYRMLPVQIKFKNKILYSAKETENKVYY